MLLRVMLVGLVTSLGLELPTEGDLDAWKQSGRDWCQTRLAEWDARMPADASAFASDPAEIAVKAPDAAEAKDLAFDLAMGETTRSFEVDHALLEAARALASLPPAVEDAFDAERTLELGRAAEPLVDALAVAEPAAAPELVPSPEVDINAPSRGARLAAAVRLTSQAAHAWASLLQGSTSISFNP